MMNEIQLLSCFFLIEVMGYLYREHVGIPLTPTVPLLRPTINLLIFFLKLLF